MNKEETTNNQTKGGAGALWGTLIVMVVLLFGAFYMFTSKINVEKQATVLQEINNEADDIKTIELDSKSMDINKLDAEINSL
jgi:hypothetical protein